MILEIVRDQDPESPRDWDNLGTFYMTHRRYAFGDAKAKNIDINTFQGIFLPVYMYDHSGITVSTTPFSCPWDSGQIGWIYASVEKVKKDFGWKRLTKKRRDEIKSILDGEIKVLDQYLQGDIYGFNLIGGEGDVLDSCWGFYGDDPKTNGMAEHLNQLLDTLEIRRAA